MPASTDFPEVENATKLTRQAWRVLREQKDALDLPHLRIQPLERFIERAALKKLSLEQKHLLIDQAEILIRDLYAHLPFKQKLYAPLDPFLELAAIRIQVNENQLAELDFHLSLMLAFAGLRDSHTRYEMPSPFNRAVAFLPFQLRAIGEPGAEPRYIVTKVMKTKPDDGFDLHKFGPGAEIIRWGLTPIAQAVEIAAQLLPGANRAATLSRGAALLTHRPLGSAGWMIAGGPPYRPVTNVVLEYRPVGGGKLRGLAFPWGVATGFQTRPGIPEAAFSMNTFLWYALAAGRALLNHDQIRYEQWARNILATLPAEKAPLVSTMPTVFQVQHTLGDILTGFTNPDSLKDVENPDKRVAHLRIRSFPLGAGSLATDALVAEFQRLLTILNTTAPDGLILDVRGNPGGDIQAAERMLQMLTPRKIIPCRFHFIRTKTVLGILRRGKRTPLGGQAESEFKPWLSDATLRSSPGRLLTVGRPLTLTRDANKIGQVYQGPVVLLIDARTYSAADIFAAGFQDHAIGTVIGVDPNTGGGGANVWTHDQAMEKLPSHSGVKLVPLPRGAGMSVAIRRALRTGRNHGTPIEDTGVIADMVAPRTKADLIFDDASVIQFCRTVLMNKKAARIDVVSFEVSPKGVRIRVRCANVHRLVFFLNGARNLERPVSRLGKVVVVKRTPHQLSPSKLKIEGYSASGKLVAVTSLDLQAGAAQNPQALAAGAGGA